MKTNILKSAAALFAAAAVLSGCLPSKLGNTPSLTIQAAQENFDDSGEATVSLVLSEAASDDVAVNLSASGDLAAAVSFEKAVVISAGNKSLDVKVTLTDKTKSGGVTIAIDAVNGATIGKAKSVTLVATKAAVPTVSISSYDDVFNENNAATITLALNPAASADVTVTLAVAAKESEEFAVIPADAVTLDAQVIIPAGQKSATATVSVNPELLPTGDSYLYIDVTAVSEGAEIGKNIEAVICFTKPIVANLRSDWTVTYKGTNDEGLDAVDYNVSSETQNFYAAIYPKGAVAAEFESLSAYLQWYQSGVAEYAGTEYAYKPITGTQTIKYQRLSPDSYEAFIIACDEKGNVTGDYATGEFSIEASAEMLAAVEGFLGEWVLNHYNVTIEQQEGVNLVINGLQGFKYPVEARVDWDGTLVIENQPWIEETETEEIGLYGLLEEGNLWQYSGFPIASISLNDDGETAVVSPAVAPNDQTFSSIAFLEYVIAEKKFYLAGASAQLALPATMSRPKDAVEETSPVVEASYADFIGTWDYNGYELLIEQNVEGESYFISGFPGSDYEKPVATFSEGALHLKEAVIGQWTHSTYGKCYDIINAMFSYKEEEYPGFGWSYGEPAEIFALKKHESGNLSFYPGTVTIELKDESKVDCPIVGICYAWQIAEGDYAGRGSQEASMPLVENVAVIRTGDVPVAEPSSLKKAAGRKVSTLKTSRMEASVLSVRERMLR